MKQEDFFSNAIGYLRLSAKDQSRYSLDDQEAAIRQYCRDNNLELVALFRDNGECSDTFDRANFLALEDFIRQHRGKVSYLIIMAHDRFSRDLAEALLKIREFERKFRIKVLEIDEPLELDTSDPNVFLQRAFKYLLANHELLQIRKRTRRGIRNALTAGRFINFAPLGYKNARDESGKGIIIVDHEKAPIVQAIFRLYLSGMPFFEISKQVRKLGYRYTGKSVLRKILGNPVYAGLIRVPALKKMPERMVKGLHEPLINPADYWRAQELLREKPRRKTQPREDFPLRGILKCECGLSMTAGWSKGRRNYYLYYRCTRHTNVNIPGKSLHETFDNVLHQLSLRKDQIAKIKKAAARMLEDAIRGRSKRMEALKSSLTELEKKIDGLEEKVVNDEIEAATYKKWFRKFSQERGNLMHELDKLRQDDNDRWKRMEGLLPRLAGVPALYQKANLRQKHLLLRGVFKDGLMFKDGAFRTASINPAFAHNVLKMKEKGLLVVEQPSEFFSKVETCSP